MANKFLPTNPPLKRPELKLANKNHEKIEKFSKPLARTKGYAPRRKNWL